jgi:transposase
VTIAEQCRGLLLENERDTTSIDRRYQTKTARMQAGMELRREREQLLDQLESLTGRREFRIDEIAAAIPKQSPGDGGDGPKEKEPVHV